MLNESVRRSNSLTALFLPIDGTKPDLSVTIAKAVNLKAATQAMISTLKAPRQKDKDKNDRGRHLRTRSARSAR